MRNGQSSSALNRAILAMLISLIASISFSHAASAADAAGAKAFLDEVYSHFPMSAGGYDPLGRHASEVFEPSMVVLFQEDRKLSAGDEGAFDSDPFCQCQDDGGMTAHVTSAQLTGPSTASAVVLIHSTSPRPETRRINVTLVVVGGRWRIRDMGGATEPSLKAKFIRENRALRRGRQ